MTDRDFSLWFTDFWSSYWWQWLCHSSPNVLPLDEWSNYTHIHLQRPAFRLTKSCKRTARFRRGSFGIEWSYHYFDSWVKFAFWRTFCIPPNSAHLDLIVLGGCLWIDGLIDRWFIFIIVDFSIDGNKRVSWRMLLFSLAVIVRLIFLVIFTSLVIAKQ